MILWEAVGCRESHPVYAQMEVENGNRHYSFLQSIVAASLEMGRPFLSTQILKALNYHAIACLHAHAGEFRPCEVTVGHYHPPASHRVQSLMDDFVNSVNRRWEGHDPLVLATYVLWKINHIHPFINGNGRTARGACYFVVCVSAGGWLPGTKILPELLKEQRTEYVNRLRHADETAVNTGIADLGPLHEMVSVLLGEQLQSASSNGAADSAAPAAAIDAGQEPVGENGA